MQTYLAINLILILISHLLNMDNINLYARSERDINSLIHLTRIYSKDIRMSFGLDKYSRIISKRAKVITTDGVELPESTIIDIEKKATDVLRSHR